MNVAELAQVLDGCINKNVISGPKIKEPPPPINWSERRCARKALFMNYLKLVLIIAGIDLVFLSLPILLAAPQFGVAVILGLSPMLLVSISWALPCWIFFDKPTIFMSTTLGVIPLRIALVLGYVYLMRYALNINMLALVIAMMIHWILFMIPEIIMLNKFSALPLTAEEEGRLYS